MSGMRRVEAIITLFKLADVRARLESLGVGGLTISEVTGVGGGEQGRTPGHRGTSRFGHVVPRLQLVAVVPDARVPEVVEAILDRAHTGRSGDGEVVVAPIDDVVRVRTGERGLAAV